MLPDKVSRTLIARIAQEFSRPADTVLVSGLHAYRIAAVVNSHGYRHTAVDARRPLTVGHHADGASGDTTPGQKPGERWHLPPVPPHSAGLVLALELPNPWITPTGQPYLDWRSWLRPGGVLAVLTANPAGTGCFTNHTGRIVAAAQAAGLTYRQHIVTIQAHLSSEQPSTPPAPVGPSPATRKVHVSAHLDLLIFTADQGDIR